MADFPLEEPRGTYWEQFFLKKSFFFQILSQKCSENGKIFRLHSVNCILRGQKNIFRKFFLKFEDLFSQFRTFSKNNSEHLSKLLSMSPEDRFGKKLFFQHRDIFPRLLDIQPTFLRFWVTKSRVVCQNYNSTFPKKRFFEEEHFLEKLMAFLFKFGPWTKTFSTFVEKIAAGLPNLHSSSPKELFEENKALQREKFFCLFETLSNKLSDVGKLFLTAFSKLHITYPQENVPDFFTEFGWPILSLWDFLKKKSDVFSKLHSMGPRERFFSENLNFFHVVRTWSSKFLDFWLKKVAKVAKLPLNVPRGTSWGEQCLNQNYFLFFRLRAKKVRTMAIIFICVLLTAYWLSRGTLFGTFFWSSMTHFVTFRLFGNKMGRLSKQLSIIPEDRLVKKGPSQVTFFFPTFSDFEQ